MYELIIIICRFLFLFYMLYFLWHSFSIILTAQNYIKRDIASSLSKQRIIIMLFHITAFLILAYVPDTYSYNIDTLITGGLSLLLFVLSYILLNKIYNSKNSLIWNSIFFLCDIGLATLQRLTPELAKKQLLWFFIGFFIILFIPFFLNLFKKLSRFKYIYLGIVFTMLFLTLFFGKTEGGAKSWLAVGNITFQPSEIVKLFFIFYLASELAVPKVKIKNIIISAAASAVVILLLVIQRDLGSALIFFMTYIAVLYISTSSVLLVSGGIFSASIASVLAYNIFSHVKIRVSTWLNPWTDIENSGYQITQSLFAIGTYGLLGSGLTRGMPKSIPVVEKDFIFSAICEEFGVIFGTGIIIILLTVFYSCIKTALASRDRFMSVLVAAFTSLMCFQSFLIIGGVTKFIPLTGVTLPFISYGGTSILLSFVIIGLIQTLSRENK